MLNDRSRFALVRMSTQRGIRRARLSCVKSAVHRSDAQSNDLPAAKRHTCLGKAPESKYEVYGSRVARDGVR